ncbi:protein translocase subunit SecDF [Candidatus Cardinium hertigii]|uniref:Multifunctional fusion protein n=1 Tax=Candidatus Cardinium hertigii TaxID=247481 RepID=A0A2Z3L931_9BACT|nr:protein translocase subunit SecDF [Candidatus Cardinium hertigii]AWN82063.1 Protein translocase subunit SecDF [Candidatus Cardinium hertigii]
MRAKKIVLFVTVVTSFLSLYYLSFTFIDYRIQRQAEQKATDQEGRIDFEQRQAYLMEMWKKPVYNLLGSHYTYEEVKDRSLKLGLDLQGGTRVVMELSPVELVKALAGDNADAAFFKALQSADKERMNKHTASFAKRFIEAYKKIEPEGDLSDIFTSLSNEKEIEKTIDKEISLALDRSLTIVRTRLDRFGASQPTVQRLPITGRIQIELPGITDAQRVRKLLQGIAQLHFWEVAEPDEYIAYVESVNKFLLAEEKAAILKTLPQGIPEEEKNKHMPTQSLFQRCARAHFPYTISYAAQEVDHIKSLLARAEVRALLPAHITWMWGKAIQIQNDRKEEIVTLYPIKRTPAQKPLLEGDLITRAESLLDNGRPVVTMHMNSRGAHIWKEVTANQVGKRIAIVLDDQVYSAPVVQQEIPNGVSQISGDFSLEDAKDLANILQAGSLPAPLKIVEEVIMGPTLGKIAQNQGLVTTAIGLALVLLFMMVYYAKAGMIANMALLFNLLFMAGMLAQLEATLTLPGIAGLVLTIGMSIDANVLIFERIREELADKVPLKEAIRRGYAKSASSIIDSNITTFLVGVILYCLGQGQVRGFAIILMIGIVSSLFSSIFITQLFFSFYMERYPAPSITFAYGNVAMLFKRMKINFIAIRYRLYIFSLLFITLGGFCFYYCKGLAVGVDFAGGRAYVVRFDSAVEASSLRDRLATEFAKGVEVRTYGANHVMQITTSYLSHDDSLAADETVKDKLETALQQYAKEKGEEPASHANFCIVSSSKVTATVAQDIQKSAKKAIIFALFAIFIYTALRFRKWSYGVAAIVALIHDALAVVAGFCMARALGFSYEVNEVFLAAMLTIIGYSINDTVVIFDRIREKIKSKGNTTIVEASIINQAIGETLSRTVITSFTTLLTVAMLFFFGGEALRGFSFALLLGVLFGTYSSICMAAPLLTDLSNKFSKASALASKQP